MSELGDDARAFLAQARGAHDAPAGAKERVRGGLAAALSAASSAGEGARGPRARASLRGESWIAAAKVVVAVALVGGGAALVFGRAKTAHEPTSPAPTASAEVVASPPPSPAIPEPAILPEAPAPSAPSAAVAVPAPPPRASASPPARANTDQSVAAEVALLRKVSASLRAGDAKGALAGVDEHARRFPNGALAEERDMERIVALCKLGRRDEAEQATKLFSTAYPTSSHEARIRAACAIPGSSGVAQ
jgi:type IV secretory pathway VirB10-like protein